ncbi:hypothetical protein H0H92_001404, partial [Tricholoma furcatifolium]
MGDDEAEDAPEDELVELMAYENDYYARESEDERLFAVREVDDEDMVGALTEMPEETNRVKMRKVVLRTTKETLTRPLLPSKAKECLATWETFNGMKAWTLWDSGSTTSGLTPAYAHVAKIRVSQLEKPITLQLGTIGSRSIVNYGAIVAMEKYGVGE